MVLDKLKKLIAIEKMEIPYIATAIFKLVRDDKVIDPNPYTGNSWESSVSPANTELKMTYIHADEITKSDEGTVRTKSLNVVDLSSVITSRYSGSNMVIEGEGISGLEIQKASTYGAKIEMSFSDYKNMMYEYVNVNDYIFIWVFDLSKVDEIFSDVTAINLFKDKKLLIKELIKLGAIKKPKISPSFGGIITRKFKSVATTSQLKIEAQDFTRIFMHYNIPRLGEKKDNQLKVQIADKAVGVDYDDVHTFSALHQFFVDAVRHALKNNPSLKLESLSSIDTIPFKGTTTKAVTNKLTGEKIDKNKIHLSFVKGFVVVLKIHPVLLAEIVYKYYFHLLGYDEFVFPHINDKIYHEVNGIRNNKTYGENFLTLGIIFSPKKDDEGRFVFSPFETKAISKDTNAFRTLITDEEILLTFNLVHQTTFYMKPSGVISSGHLALSELVDFYRKGSSTPEVDGYKILEIPKKTITNTDGSSVEVDAYINEISHITRYYTNKSFHESIGLDKLLLNNQRTWRGTDFNVTNTFVASTIHDLKKSTSIMYVLKTLLFSQHGFFEPVYDKSEIRSSLRGGDEYHIINSIRSTMWTRIDFRVHPKLINNKITRMLLIAELNLDYITHNTKENKAFIGDDALKTEDIIEFEINNFSDFPTLVNITSEGNKTITIINDLLGNTGKLSPSSVLSIDSKAVLPYAEEYLPSTFNSYSITKTGFVPIAKIPANDRISSIIPDTEENIYMTVHPTDLGTITWRKMTDSNTTLIVYSPKDGSSKEAKFSTLAQNSQLKNYLISEPQDDSTNIQWVICGVIRYLNPRVLLSQSEDLMRKMIENQDEITNFNYNAFNETSFIIDENKKDGRNDRFIDEVLDGETKKKISLLRLLDNFIHWLKAFGNEEQWCRIFPIEMYVRDKRSGKIDDDNFRIATYDFEKDVFKVASGGSEHSGISLDVTRNIYLFYRMMMILNIIGRYYDETLASRATLLKLFLSAGSYDINVGDKINIKGIGRGYYDVPKLEGKITDMISSALNLEALGIEPTSDYSTGSQKVQIVPESIRDRDFFVWKKVLYIGNAGSTSGFTQKLLLTDNPLNWNMKFEEENITTRIAQTLRNKSISNEGVYF